MALFATKVGGAEGKSDITLVGTYNNTAYGTTNIDLKNDLPDYNDYTVDDFIVIPKTIKVNSVTVNAINRNYSPVVSSYSNGVLTLTGTGVSGGVSEGSFSSNVSVFDVYVK